MEDSRMACLGDARVFGMLLSLEKSKKLAIDQ
jgi:hypothetical protein